MNWSEMKGKIEPTILVKEKPETIKIKILAKVSNLINVDLNFNHWEIYKMKLDKYPNLNPSPWYVEHIMEGINGNLAELLYLIALYDIEGGIKNPNRKELFNTLNVSINTCINEIANRFENSFDSVEDMIEAILLMIFSKGKQEDQDIMDSLIAIAFFRDLLEPDIESVLIELIYYKLNCNKHGSKKFESD